MLIRMDEVSRSDLSTEDLYLAIPTYGMTKGMADAESPRQSLKPGVVHLIEVSNRAVRNCPDTAKGAMHVAVDLAPEGPDHCRFIQILHHHYFRPGRSRQMLPVVIPAIWVLLPAVWIAGFDHDRDRVTNHRAHVRHEIAGLFQVEPIPGGVAVGDLFPPVVDGWRIPSF